MALHCCVFSPADLRVLSVPEVRWWGEGKDVCGHCNRTPAASSPFATPYYSAGTTFSVTDLTSALPTTCGGISLRQMVSLSIAISTRCCCCFSGSIILIDVTGLAGRYVIDWMVPSISVELSEETDPSNQSNCFTIRASMLSFRQSSVHCVDKNTILIFQEGAGGRSVMMASIIAVFIIQT